MKVLVCGDRNWTDRQVIEDRLRLLPSQTTIIHGDCRGADKMAGEVARSLGFDVVPCPADWGKHGRAAGPIRNREMLKMRPNLVIAFHDDLGKSRGTKNCLMQALEEGVGIEAIGSGGEEWTMPELGEALHA
jgi:YspA, cpYpsA-related SLOG family